MDRDELRDLAAFVAVAKARSFTRAAQALEVSQPSLSNAVRRLEGALGAKLLERTTRSVAPTPTGERLLTKLAPRFEEIDAHQGVARRE